MPENESGSLLRLQAQNEELHSRLTALQGVNESLVADIASLSAKIAELEQTLKKSSQNPVCQADPRHLV